MEKEEFARRHLVPDLGQLHVDDVAEGVLRVVGDADGDETLVLRAARHLGNRRISVRARDRVRVKICYDLHGKSDSLPKIKAAQAANKTRSLLAMTHH